MSDWIYEATLEYLVIRNETIHIISAINNIGRKRGVTCQLQLLGRLLTTTPYSVRLPPVAPRDLSSRPTSKAKVAHLDLQSRLYRHRFMDCRNSIHNGLGEGDLQKCDPIPPLAPPPLSPFAISHLKRCPSKLYPSLPLTASSASARI